uniref:L-Fucosyltransferase n=1 Tax=Panagrellus redivivus TaxID=6233 RepID=A0A7E4ZZI9_PANRE
MSESTTIVSVKFVLRYAVVIVVLLTLGGILVLFNNDRIVNSDMLGYFIAESSAVSMKTAKSTNSNRFIQLHISDAVGLGNQMYRLASLYGIGRIVNRKPSLNSAVTFNQILAKELRILFPKLFDTVTFNTIANESVTHTAFGSDCCTYADPKIIHETNTTWLIMDGNYYQSYKYFNAFKEEILAMFEFGPKINAAVRTYVSQLFGFDKFHKLCVHIRRGDFLGHQHLESRTDFIVPAVSRVFEFLHNESHFNDLSLVFIGVEANFWNALNVTHNFKPYFNNIYMAKLASRGEDLAFGSTYCDSLLISASGSTFAWWMAYLGKPTMAVFYNGQVNKHRNHSKDYHDYDMFPPEWHKLELNRTTRKVRFEKQWNFELFKQWY